jgi:hypothetical protein
LFLSILESFQLFFGLYFYRVNPSTLTNQFENGKPGESRGHKAMGLQPPVWGYDCQAAEQNASYGLGFSGRFYFMGGLNIKKDYRNENKKYLPFSKSFRSNLTNTEHHPGGACHYSFCAGTKSSFYFDPGR